MTIDRPLPIHILEYKVVRVLGQGGGSTVYEVCDEKFERFALKHIIRASPAEEVHADQALHEFRVASEFRHANVRKIYSVTQKRALGSPRDMMRKRSLFVISEVVTVMELIEGETLEQHPVHDMSAVCRIFLEVASGLAALHDAGWVHADLKPHNIMFTPGGDVKVIDLGLACRDHVVPTRIRGTPGFIAPEQALRKHVTKKTDIFSFGATMYNMLTGNLVPTVLPPRNARGGPVSEFDLSKTPSPKDLNPAIPPALSGLVMDCLRPKPEQRPPSIKIVRERLSIASQQSRGEKIQM